MRNRRRYLISVSLTIHLAVFLALFVSGVWRIDRLDAPKHTIDLAVALPPPPAPAGSPAANAVEFDKKKPKVITHDIVVKPKDEPETPPTPAADKPPGNGEGSGSGSGSGSGDPNTPGECTGDDCGPPVSETKPVEKKKEEVGCGVPPCDPIKVPPPVIRGMRLSGETQIQMSEMEKTSLLRSGKTRATASAKVCIGARGEVSSLSMYAGSGYAGWDAAILGAMRNWRYRAYQIGGKPVPVCGMVTFMYEIH